MMNNHRTNQGYRVIAGIGNKFVLAFNPKATQPWAIWRIDRDGDFYGGEYIFDKATAMRKFREYGFKGVV